MDANANLKKEFAGIIIDSDEEDEKEEYQIEPVEFPSNIHQTAIVNQLEAIMEEPLNESETYNNANDSGLFDDFRQSLNRQTNMVHLDTSADNNDVNQTQVTVLAQNQKITVDPAAAAIP